MNRDELIDTLSSFVRKALANPEADIIPDASFVDLGLNSSGLLELFFMIEEKWDLTLDEDDTDELKTFNDVVQLMERLLA